MCQEVEIKGTCKQKNQEHQAKQHFSVDKLLQKTSLDGKEQHCNVSFWSLGRRLRATLYSLAITILVQSLHLTFEEGAGVKSVFLFSSGEFLMLVSSTSSAIYGGKFRGRNTMSVLTDGFFPRIKCN